MKLLGIDYGLRKIGLSLGDTKTKLATPLKVLKVKNEIDGLEKIVREMNDLEIDKVVFGISEGKTEERTRDFSLALQKKVDVQVCYEDETLTTYDAQMLSLEAGIGRKKRKEKEDAYAATLILQKHLDSL